MTAIFGIVAFAGGEPVGSGEVELQAAAEQHRGRDGIALWLSEAAGLGHALTSTTDTDSLQLQPLVHVSGLVIAGDIRLDNRADLASSLGLEARLVQLSDAGLVIESYVKWGEKCVSRLMGDFAFVVWDPTSRTLFGARDRFGLRQLHYHHQPGRQFVFATDAHGIVALQRVPYRLTDEIVADALTDHEGLDLESTPFIGVFRLPPAYTLTVSQSNFETRRYWVPTVRTPTLSSDEEYCEAFLDVFRPAVAARLRGPSVASMLSGGMDSASVVAIASELTRSGGFLPITALSGTAPEGDLDVETRLARLTARRCGAEQVEVPMTFWANRADEFRLVGRATGSPFDAHMTLPHALYATAAQRGFRVLLDGVAGDNVFSTGPFIRRLVQRGHLTSAVRQARALERTQWTDISAVRLVGSALLGPARPAIRHLRALSPSRSGSETLNPSILTSEAWQAASGRGSTALANGLSSGCYGEIAGERVRSVTHPYLTVGRERYDRVASVHQVEPRDPFLDVRVVEFALGLRDDLTTRDGFPKYLLRRSMQSRLPPEVVWKHGRDHLGFRFTLNAVGGDTLSGVDLLSLAQDIVGIRHDLPDFLAARPPSIEHAHELIHIRTWVRSHQQRPMPQPLAQPPRRVSWPPQNG